MENKPESKEKLKNAKRRSLEYYEKPSVVLFQPTHAQNNVGSGPDGHAVPGFNAS